MKRLYLISCLLIAAAGMTQCQRPRARENNAGTENQPAADTGKLAARMEIAGKATLKDSITLVFRVVNKGIDTLKFTTYHTPFEGFMSAFLSIRDSAGAVVPYIGPMAKRVMPPPAGSYRSVPPGAEIHCSVDLKKGFRFSKAGTYQADYTGGGINGLQQEKPLSFAVSDE